jgi:16S rRNA (guanine527-N7)-methyltransferase
MLPGAVRYVEMLGTDGVERGLIGPREADRLWDRHVVNSAVVSEVIPHGADVVDVGSGAGLPGVPLALARPDLHVTLLEPMQRRCAFLAEVVDALELADRVVIVRGRAPDAAAAPRCLRFDVAVARAVAPLDRLGGWLLPMLRSGGIMMALRGSKVDEELMGVRGDLEVQGWRDVEVVKCGADWLDEPTRVLRAVRGTNSNRARRGTHDEDGRPSRDQRARGRPRST